MATGSQVDGKKTRSEEEQCTWNWTECWRRTVSDGQKFRERPTVTHADRQTDRQWQTDTHTLS